MADDGVDVIVATGGTAVVRAAYRSGNPSLGVGPGNVPALVDATADVAQAARLPRRLEGVRQLDPVHERVGGDRRGARGRTRSRASWARNGAHVLDEEEARARATALYPGGRIDDGAGRQGRGRAGRGGGDPRAGRDARAGRAVPADRARGAARAREAVPAARAGRACRTRRAGSTPRGRCCGSAAPATRRSSTRATRARSSPTARRCGVLRVTVNAPGSTGSSGLDTNLAPTMTIGTGFFGRSSLTENLQPQHLTQWTRLAYASDPTSRSATSPACEPWSARPEPAPVAARRAGDGELTRDELRRADPRRAAGAGGR